MVNSLNLLLVPLAVFQLPTPEVNPKTKREPSFEPPMNFKDTFTPTAPIPINDPFNIESLRKQQQEEVKKHENLLAEDSYREVGILTHKANLSKDMNEIRNILLQLSKEPVSNSPGEATKRFYKAAKELKLKPIGDGRFISETYPGIFTLQPQDCSIFVTNRKGTDGNPIPNATYISNEKGNFELVTRNKELYWTEAITKLKAYKNINGTYSMYGEDAELTPQIDGSFYDKKNKRTFAKVNDSWSWDNMKKESIQTSEALLQTILKFNLTSYKTDGSFSCDKYPDARCYPTNFGTVIVIDDKKEKLLILDPEKENPQELRNYKLVKQHTLTPNSDGSWRFPGCSHPCYLQRDGSIIEPWFNVNGKPALYIYNKNNDGKIVHISWEEDLADSKKFAATKEGFWSRPGCNSEWLIRQDGSAVIINKKAEVGKRVYIRKPGNEWEWVEAENVILGFKDGDPYPNSESRSWGRTNFNTTYYIEGDSLVYWENGKKHRHFFKDGSVWWQQVAEKRDTDIWKYASPQDFGPAYSY